MKQNSTGEQKIKAENLYITIGNSSFSGNSRISMFSRLFERGVKIEVEQLYIVVSNSRISRIIGNSIYEI